MSAAIMRSGDVTRLEGRASSSVNITATEVQDPQRLARIIQDQERRLARLESQRQPRTRDFEDFDVTAGTPLRLHHGLGRVRYWVAEWSPTTPGDAALFETNDETDADTLVLDVGNDGLVTIHVRAST